MWHWPAFYHVAQLRIRGRTRRAPKCAAPRSTTSSARGIRSASQRVWAAGAKMTGSGRKAQALAPPAWPLFGGLFVVLVRDMQPVQDTVEDRGEDEARDADLLVFIDDDERPEAGWLSTLVDCQRREGCAAVAGAVVPLVDKIDDPWIHAGGFFVRQRHETGADQEAASTANLLLDLRQVRSLGDVRFDVRYGLSGGSDTLFTRTLHRNGGRIVWCDEAVVTEAITALRVAIAETPRRGTVNKGLASASADAVRQAVAAVRSCD